MVFMCEKKLHDDSIYQVQALIYLNYLQDFETILLSHSNEYDPFRIKIENKNCPQNCVILYDEAINNVYMFIFISFFVFLLLKMSTYDYRSMSYEKRADETYLKL